MRVWIMVKVDVVNCDPENANHPAEVLATSAVEAVNNALFAAQNDGFVHGFDADMSIGIESVEEYYAESD